MSKIEFIGSSKKICPLMSTSGWKYCEEKKCALWTGLECSLRRGNL